MAGIYEWEQFMAGPDNNLEQVELKQIELLYNAWENQRGLLGLGGGKRSPECHSSLLWNWNHLIFYL